MSLLSSDSDVCLPAIRLQKIDQDRCKLPCLLLCRSNLGVCSFCLIHATKLWRAWSQERRCTLYAAIRQSFCRTKSKRKDPFVYLVPKKTMLSMWFSSRYRKRHIHTVPRDSERSCSVIFIACRSFSLAPYGSTKKDHSYRSCSP